MTVASFVIAAGGILSLLGALGGGAAFLVAGRQKGTIVTLTESNDAQEKRIVGLKEELAEVRFRGEAQLAEARLAEAQCQQRLGAAEAAIATLTGIVTNARAVEEMLARVDLYHADLVALSTKVDVNHEDLLVRLSS